MKTKQRTLLGLLVLVLLLGGALALLTRQNQKGEPSRCPPLRRTT